MAMYYFATTWRIAAPRAAVWEALREGERYPQWWPGMEAVEVLDPGEPDGRGRHLRITTRSRLPYHLEFETIGRAVREPEHIEVEAVGELEGTGRWDLRQNGEVTTAVYTWEVGTTKAWMQLLAPFARPAFVWNHHVLMGQGGEGLARHLGARLLGQKHVPPLRATDWAPLAGLAVGLTGLFVGCRRAWRA